MYVMLSEERSFEIIEMSPDNIMPRVVVGYLHQEFTNTQPK